MNIFDTHAHYDDEKYQEDREDIIEELLRNQVKHVVNVAADLESCKTTMQLVNRYDFMYGALGIHPDNVGKLTESDLEWIASSIKEMNSSLNMQTGKKGKKIVAIGEIGLDYYWDEAPREIQKKWFVQQLKLSQHVKLPVIIHSRDSAQDTFEILHEEQFQNVHGVIHCYAYSPEMAEQYIKMGYYIGVGGVLTFRNAKKLREVVEAIPISSIVTETDAPYLTPSPYRGQRNQSTYIQYVIHEIASIKQMDEIELSEILFHNAERLYGIV